MGNEREAIVADAVATGAELVTGGELLGHLNQPPSLSDGTTVQSQAIAEPGASDKKAVTSGSEETQNTQEDPRMEDARQRAVRQRLTGNAIEIKARLEIAFAELPEGEDVTVIMLSTVIAERVVTCTDRAAAIEVATRAIHERAEYKDPIRRNADALKSAVEEVLARFFRN